MAPHATPTGTAAVPPDTPPATNATPAHVNAAPGTPALSFVCRVAMALSSASWHSVHLGVHEYVSSRGRRAMGLTSFGGAACVTRDATPMLATARIAFRITGSARTRAPVSEPQSTCSRYASSLGVRAAERAWPSATAAAGGCPFSVCASSWAANEEPLSRPVPFDEDPQPAAMATASAQALNHPADLEQCISSLAPQLLPPNDAGSATFQDPRQVLACQRRAGTDMNAEWCNSDLAPAIPARTMAPPTSCARNSRLASFVNLAAASTRFVDPANPSFVSMPNGLRHDPCSISPARSSCSRNHESFLREPLPRGPKTGPGTKKRAPRNQRKCASSLSCAGAIRAVAYEAGVPFEVELRRAA